MEPALRTLLVGEQREGEYDRRGDGAHVALQKVAAKAGHVAHVVAHVVGDGGGVAGVVLGDVRLGLADQVSAHVRRLGVDAAAHAVEHGHDGAAQRVAGHGHGEGHEGNAHPVRGGNEVLRVELAHAETEDQKDDGKAEQGKARHAQAHDAAAAEGDLQRLSQFGG